MESNNKKDLINPFFNEGYYLEDELKILVMKPHELVRAMIQGLKNEHVKVDLHTYGMVNDGICYGCAATNAICEIYQKKHNKDSIEDVNDRGLLFGIRPFILNDIEQWFDALRRGVENSTPFDDLFKDLSISWEGKYLFPTKMNFSLPEINNSNYKDPLIIKHYLDLADELEKIYKEQGI